MKSRPVLYLPLLLLSLLASVEVCAQEEQKPATTFQKYTKWGIGIDFSRTFFNINRQEAYQKILDGEMDALPVFLENSTGPQINVFFNWRIARFFYYQPEVTYAIYNYQVDESVLRSMFVRITPIQFQFGVHLGWARPYIFAGAHLDIAINIRDMANQKMEGSEYQFENFGSRLYWGYTYGGGVDFLSFIQLQYQRNLWMNPFTSFTESMHLVDEAICLSFFF